MAQVINIGKYKKHNEINAVAKHNLRCYIPKNVDEDRQKDNIFFVGKQGQRGISRIVTEKLKDIPHRKDANKVVNLVFKAFWYSYFEVRPYLPVNQLSSSR